IIDKLVVYPENMRKNLERLGRLVHFPRVMIPRTQKGPPRQDPHPPLPPNPMRAPPRERDFLALPQADKDVRKHLSPAELKENFDLGYHLQRVDTIFERVFGRSS